MKLQASSILYAVIVAVLVALMSASLLLHARLSERHVRLYRTQDRVLTNASSGMELLLSEFTAVDLHAPQVVDLFDEAQDSVYLERRNWGIYEVAVSRAYFRNILRERIALVGYDLHEDSRIALYLADQNKPLSLCGNTEVRGTAFVPKAGVKRAYIEGQNYNGRQLIYGEQKQSSRQLPALSAEMLASNRDYLNGMFRETDSVITFDDLDVDTVVQSFARPSLVVAESGPIDLLDGHFAGNIILVSEESVFIGAGAELDGVLVYAPQITVEEGFTGRAQLFASARIAVGPSATLAFPSVVGLIKPEDGQEETAIALSEASTVRGIVFIRQDRYDHRHQPRITVDASALVEGQVYADGVMDLKGTVHGSLYCSRFLLNTPSSVYENHLLNATVDFGQLSPFYVGANLVHFSERKKVIEWLN